MLISPMSTMGSSPAYGAETDVPYRTVQRICTPRNFYSLYRIKYPAAITTNLLFDLVGAPNLGVEVPVGNHFSIAVDATYAYWRIKNRYALQTIQGGGEVKYWFSFQEMAGWNIGVYGLYGSRYDVQWQDGYQGDSFWSAGVSAGYAIPLSRRISLEFAIAAGYFYTPEVRHYHWSESEHLLWEETRYNVGKVSLTKVKINLVWFIGKKKLFVK